MTIQTIPLAQLRLCPHNARPDPGDVETLKASIRQHGLLNPLTVRPLAEEEAYAVIAGGRRFKALQELASEGDLIPTAMCNVVDPFDETHAIETSIAENIERRDMHPLEEAEAFARLISSESVEDIATHFGRTERFVRQRLALAELDDSVKKAVRKGSLSIGAAQLLTMAGPKEQKRLAKLARECAANGNHLTADQVRRELTHDKIPVHRAIFNHKLAKNGITSDLFGEDAWFNDAEEFFALQWGAMETLAEKMKAHFEEVRLVDQRKGASGYYDLGLQPDPEGPILVLWMAWNGEFRDGRARKLAKQAAKAKGGSDEAAAPVAQPELTKGFVAELNAARLMSIQNRMLTDFRMTLIYAIVALTESYGNLRVKDAEIPGEVRERHARDEESKRLLRQGVKLLNPKGGVQPREKLVARLCKLDQVQLETIFCALLAPTLDDPFQRDRVHTDQIVDLIGEAFEVDPREDWKLEPGDLEKIRNRKTLAALAVDLGMTEAAAEKGKAKELRGFIAQTMPKKPDWRPRWLEPVWRSYLDPAESPSPLTREPVTSRPEGCGGVEGHAYSG